MESISLSDDDELGPSCKQIPELMESSENIEYDEKSKNDKGNDMPCIVTTPLESLPASELNQESLIESVSTDITTPTNIEQSENAKTIETKDSSTNVSEQSEAVIIHNSTSQESSYLSSEKSTMVQSTSSSIQNSGPMDENISSIVNADPSYEISSVDGKSAPDVLYPKLLSTSNETSEPPTKDIVKEIVGDNPGKAAPGNVDTEDSKTHEEESENDSVQMTNRILQLEEERGKLTTEVMEKEILTLKMEKETTSLKSEISQLESMHAAKLVDLEKKQKQTLDQMNARMTEVREKFIPIIFFQKKIMYPVFISFIMLNGILFILHLQLKKQFVVANKEKESMVMKYAIREQDIIKERAARVDSDKKCKAAFREKDEAVTKMKNAVADKTKLQLVSDSRVDIFRSFKFRKYSYLKILY